MRRSERRLLLILLGLAAMIGCLLASQSLWGWQKRLHRAEQRAALAQLEGEALLAEAGTWQAREQWLDEHQPILKDALEANQELTQAGESARARGLETLQRQLLEPESGALYHQLGFTMTVRGPLHAVFRWLHRLQHPQEFRVVSSLKVAPDKEDPSLIVATVQVWRWYRPDPPASPAVAGP